MSIEEWRPVPKLRLVEASSFGRIRRNGKLKQQFNRPRNYKSVSLYKKSYLVSRLICMAFHGLPKNNKLEAMHLDNDPTNNHSENLAWGTHRENMAMDHGNNHSQPGEKNKNAKLSADAIREIRSYYDSRISDKWGRKMLCAKFGISENHCLRIARRQIGGWAHIE